MEGDRSKKRKNSGPRSRARSTQSINCGAGPRDGGAPSSRTRWPRPGPRRATDVSGMSCAYPSSDCSDLGRISCAQGRESRDLITEYLHRNGNPPTPTRSQRRGETVERHPLYVFVGIQKPTCVLWGNFQWLHGLVRRWEHVDLNQAFAGLVCTLHFPMPQCQGEVSWSLAPRWVMEWRGACLARQSRARVARHGPANGRKQR